MAFLVAQFREFHQLVEGAKQFDEQLMTLSAAYEKQQQHKKLLAHEESVNKTPKKQAKTMESAEVDGSGTAALNEDALYEALIRTASTQQLNRVSEHVRQLIQQSSQS